MTIIMTIIGSFVFLFSSFRNPFKVAMKRLWTFALTGVIIDMTLISLAIFTGYVALN